MKFLYTLVTVIYFFYRYIIKMDNNINDNLGAFMCSDSKNFIIHSEDMDDDQEYSLTAENTDDSNHGEKSSCVIREQDRYLPIANVAKIMKKAIPEPGKIAKDARECVQECVSEFISFITSEASDRCHMEKRKTVNGEDILFAMTNLGFDNYVEPLKLYLQKYRETVKGDKSMCGGDVYEEIPEEFAAHSLNGNILTTDGDDQGGAVIFYQEHSLPTFQLG